MTQKKKQNRVLYTCLILLLIAGSIFIAVAFGAGRRARPSETEDTKDSGSIEATSGAEPEPEESESESMTESSAKTEKKPAAEVLPEESVPVSVSIEDIAFVSPADGAVLASCSLTVPVYSLTMNDYRTHSGIDISADTGASVTACAAGTVTSVYEDPMMGMTVAVTHAEGIESVYKNLASELPEGIVVGKEVAAGDVIGAVGDTALVECEEESHLHFELKVNGENVDPLEYIEMVSVNEVYED